MSKQEHRQLGKLLLDLVNMQKQVLNIVMETHHLGPLSLALAMAH